MSVSLPQFFSEAFFTKVAFCKWKEKKQNNTKKKSDFFLYERICHHSNKYPFHFFAQAINCYHALAALGDTLNDPTLKGIGQITLATEIRAVRNYWHVRPDNRHRFPPMLQKWGVLGMLQEDGIYYYTLNWACEPDQFPQRHACLVGIQIIPITSVSHLFMDQVRKTYATESVIIRFKVGEGEGRGGGEGEGNIRCK